METHVIIIRNNLRFQKSSITSSHSLHNLQKEQISNPHHNRPTKHEKGLHLLPLFYFWMHNISTFSLITNFFICSHLIPPPKPLTLKVIIFMKDQECYLPKHPFYFYHPHQIPFFPSLPICQPRPHSFSLK